jgi:hypothetical protein
MNAEHIDDTGPDAVGRHMGACCADPLLFGPRARAAHTPWRKQQEGSRLTQLSAADGIEQGCGRVVGNRISGGGREGPSSRAPDVGDVGGGREGLAAWMCLHFLLPFILGDVDLEGVSHYLF